MSIASVDKLDFWSLVLDSVTIDPSDLLAAINVEAGESGQDFRTRVLLRDSFLALQKRWGDSRLRALLSPTASSLMSQLLTEELGDRGFSSLEQRLMEHTRPEKIQQFLRELGSSIYEPCRINIGGSSALILMQMLSRQTDDIDAVNEVPAPIRNDHALLEKLIVRYGLRLAHFQSHYLPDHWESRLHSLGSFGQLQVYLVDHVDIVLGKLFSRREKDLDDLRMLVTVVTRPVLEDRLRSAGGGLLSDPQFRSNAEKNWYILFGDSLPA